MKFWKKWLGTAAGLFLTGYFLYFAFKTFHTQDLSIFLKPSFLIVILVAGFLNIFLVPLSGQAWSILLHSMGSHWTPAKLSAIIGFTQMAKYVPGNIAQHVGRTTVTLMAGMSASIFLFSVLIESILLLSASVFMGFFCLVFSSIPMPVINIPLFHSLPALTIGIVTSAAIILVTINYLPKLAQRFSHSKNIKLTTFPPAPNIGAIIQAFLLYCLSYLILGLSLWIIASQYNGLLQIDFFTLTASFSLAWLTGYLAPGAPAGLGVREGALAFLLSNIGPTDLILTVVIATRFATILADIISFTISAFFMKYSGKEKSKVC